MAFQLSPGINISEIDLTTVVPAVATTEGAMVGVFRWGPTDERVLISSEIELVSTFGRPYANTSWQNYETFFTGANFLSYSDALYVTRVVDATANTATDGTNFNAAYPGALGNEIEVATCDANTFAASTFAGTIEIDASAREGSVIRADSNDITEFVVGDTIIVDGQELTVATVGTAAQVANTADYETVVTFENKYVSATNFTGSFDHQWGFANIFDAAPSTGHLHVVVVDKAGVFTDTGVKTVVELYSNLSTTPGAKRSDGASNFIDTVLEQRSNTIRVKTSGTYPSGAGYIALAGGLDGLSETASGMVGAIAQGWDLYKSKEDVDVSLLLNGAPISLALTNYIIDSVAEYRKDCVAFVTPPVTQKDAHTAQEVVTATDGMSASSYVVVDSGFKYQYDKYNDVYRWIPLNGDVAGLCARTDDERDPWFSPAGYQRGSVKNVVKLALNPNRTERDLLYKNYINPVVTQPGQGTVLFGDKTFQGTPSAFDRINVRRLFIVLEKAIEVASKTTLFEFNDEFTRAQFVNLVEPFLRDVQGRRGIYDFRVVCDETNNTGQVIDSNQFVGDIYIKPARSINFIQLNFVAVRSGVEFSEIVGQV